MSQDKDDSLIPQLRSRGYRSRLVGNARYETVGQALNSPLFWESVNRDLSNGARKLFKILGDIARALNSV